LIGPCSRHIVRPRTTQWGPITRDPPPLKWSDAALYAPDALLSFTTWTATGRAAIQEGFTKEFAAVDVKITAINVDQAQRLGDWEHSRGTWAAEMKAPDGKAMPMNGHWLIIGTCQGRIGYVMKAPKASKAYGMALRWGYSGGIVLAPSQE
jgi:hypothetical protein